MNSEIIKQSQLKAKPNERNLKTRYPDKSNSNVQPLIESLSSRPVINQAIFKGFSNNCRRWSIQMHPKLATGGCKTS